jgi:hypothetical protein
MFARNETSCGRLLRRLTGSGGVKELALAL